MKCEYENDKGHCTLNECMYGDFLERDDSSFNSGVPYCFKPDELTIRELRKAMVRIANPRGLLDFDKAVEYLKE